MFALIIPLSGDGGQIDNSLPGGGRPDHIWGGRPGRPGGGHIDNTLPEGPQPKGVHPAVAESSIPSHPAKPDPAKPGEWLLVAMGDGSVSWAWAETAPPAPQPK